ncbi:MAG TPA: electron transfer flavoprotein subunit beta/FixA family protein [Armatimonadota bacterium]|jgi:electron transfer flavoprotein beta subunit
MHVVVCVKQVPDTTQVRVDPVTNTLIREGIPTVVNPFDYAALECALTLKDRYGAKVTLISMGPPDAVKSLKKCLSYGADRAVLLTDRAFAGSDTFATSYALSSAVRRLADDESVDIVLCGKQTIDGDTAQTGPGIARHLGWQQVTYIVGITEVNAEAGTITAERKLERGHEIVRTQLPAVVTVVEDAPELRYASLPGMLHALRYAPEVWTTKDVSVDAAFLGLKGSPTKVKRIFPPPHREGGEIIYADTVGLEAAVTTVVQLLQQQGALKGRS